MTILFIVNLMGNIIIEQVRNILYMIEIWISFNCDSFEVVDIKKFLTFLFLIGRNLLAITK